MGAVREQDRQSEWTTQWTLFADREQRLFDDWIYPARLEDFRDKAVLDCGCGGGQHMSFCAPVARWVVGVDLNTAAIAQQRTRSFANVALLQADIATVAFRQPFDIVYCIGALHHTLNPDATFHNLKRLCKPGGRLILWCYSAEGNETLRVVLGPLQRLVTRRLSPSGLVWVARLMTIPLWLAAQTLYRFPVRGWPYYEYLAGMRRLAFSRVVLNVFDKLNAPITHFITAEQMRAWFNPTEFTDVHLSPYQGVSWRASGTRR